MCFELDQAEREGRAGGFWPDYDDFPEGTDPGQYLEPAQTYQLSNCIPTRFGCDPIVQNNRVSRWTSPVLVFFEFCPQHLSSCLYYKNRATANAAADEIFGKDEGNERGEEKNAFKHAYWMALQSQDTNADSAYLLGETYERYKTDGIVDTQKDMLNNRVGATIGSHVNKLAPRGLVANVVLTALEGGFLYCQSGEVIRAC